MNENLQILTFHNEAQAAQASAHAFYAIRGMMIIGVSLEPTEFTGSPTGFNVDIQDDGTDCITAISAATALTPVTWLSTAMAGSNTPVYIAAGSEVEVDVNLTGGSTPTASYDLHIYVLLDA